MGLETTEKQKRWLLVNAVPIVETESKKIRGVVSTFLDITESKQAEQLFRYLADSSPVGISIIQNGQFQFVNAQFQKATGYSKEELENTNSLQLVFPEDRQMVREQAIRILKGDRAEPLEYRLVTSVGETRWIMETVVPIEYHGERATLSNFVDITELKRAQQELARSRDFHLNLA